MRYRRHILSPVYQVANLCGAILVQVNRAMNLVEYFEPLLPLSILKELHAKCFLQIHSDIQDETYTPTGIDLSVII